MVEDPEVDPELILETETEDKCVSYKLSNSWSQHGDQLMSLVTSWTELKPDVCLITEVSGRLTKCPVKLLVINCRTVSACSPSEMFSVFTASFSVLSWASRAASLKTTIFSSSQFLLPGNQSDFS